MASTISVLARQKRQGTLLSGSHMIPPNAAETALRVTADITAPDLARAKTMEFRLEAQDPGTRQWFHVASAVWEGPGVEPPSFSVNILPLRGKRTRVVLDMVDEIDTGATLDLLD